MGLWQLWLSLCRPIVPGSWVVNPHHVFAQMLWGLIQDFVWATQGQTWTIRLISYCSMMNHHQAPGSCSLLLSFPPMFQKSQVKLIFIYNNNVLSMRAQSPSESKLHKPSNPQEEQQSRAPSSGQTHRCWVFLLSKELNFEMAPTKRKKELRG